MMDGCCLRSDVSMGKRGGWRERLIRYFTGLCGHRLHHHPPSFSRRFLARSFNGVTVITGSDRSLTRTIKCDCMEYFHKEWDGFYSISPLTSTLAIIIFRCNNNCLTIWTGLFADLLVVFESTTELHCN